MTWFDAIPTGTGLRGILSPRSYIHERIDQQRDEAKNDRAHFPPPPCRSILERGEREKRGGGKEGGQKGNTRISTFPPLKTETGRSLCSGEPDYLQRRTTLSSRSAMSPV